MTTLGDNNMQISERELIIMTNDLDEMHHATLPVMHAAVADWTEMQRDVKADDEPAPAIRRGPSRRGFLVGAGAGLGAVLLAACSSSKKTATATTTTAPPGTANPYTGDLAIAALAASLENLAVQTYGAGIAAAQANKLGVIPPAVVTFATTAMSQHSDHAKAWNSIITGAGMTGITGVDTTVKNAVVTPGFAKVTDATSLASFALGLENVAAATYLNGIQNALMSSKAIGIAATIQPVEMQHAAILNFVLGNYPVPNSFGLTTGARGPSDYIG